MEAFLRSWRQDALNRGQHDAAIYIGDKVLALTSMNNDLPSEACCRKSPLTRAVFWSR